MRQFRRWSRTPPMAFAAVLCVLVVVAPVVAHGALCPNGSGPHHALCISLAAGCNTSALGIPTLADWTDCGAVPVGRVAVDALLLSPPSAGRAPPAVV